MVHPTFPLIGAHTGSGQAPDNTLASFMEGIESGADVVEVDLRVTRDGTVVLLHDDTPNLREWSYEQLNEPANRIKVDEIYADHEIATLEQVLRLAQEHRVQLNLDIKSGDAVVPTIELVRAIDASGIVFITGCSEGIAGRYDGIRVVYNTPDELSEAEWSDYEAWADRQCELAQDSGAYGLNMDFRTCRPEIVDRAHARGLAVWVYTVNDPAWQRQFADMGVDEITTRAVGTLTQLRSGSAV